PSGEATGWIADAGVTVPGLATVTTAGFAAGLKLLLAIAGARKGTSWVAVAVFVDALFPCAKAADERCSAAQTPQHPEKA
ncbi:MAG TPA: hypothetical protein PKO06_17010, partial [Candidatus Ozemobacteraceae bacterium]|nr:hypothetical protein [Candidatus Ozemobacteraceae bacterium]